MGFPNNPGIAAENSKIQPDVLANSELVFWELNTAHKNRVKLHLNQGVGQRDIHIYSTPRIPDMKDLGINLEISFFYILLCQPKYQ